MHEEVINFWFNEVNPSDWFTYNINIDQIIIERFGKLHEQARQGELYEWRFVPQGALAEIIVLSGRNHNMYLKLVYVVWFLPDNNVVKLNN